MRSLIALKPNACGARTKVLKTLLCLKVIVLALLVFPIAARSETLPEPGPENHGLRLRFLISSSTEVEVRTQRMTLELLNVGQETLEWSIASCPGDPKEKYWLFSMAYFQTEPAVKDHGVQTGLRHDCVALQKRLKPGASYREEYTASDKGIFTDHNSITFPSGGVYKVTAEIYIPPGPGQIRVVSNPSSFTVDRSTGSPKQSSARIIETSKDQRNVQLALGPNHGIVPGDTFWLGWKGGGSSWKFTVTKVNAESAWADVQKMVRDREEPKMFRHVPFPGVGTMVELRALGLSAP